MHNFIGWIFKALFTMAAAVLFAKDAQGPAAAVTVTLATEVLVQVGAALTVPNSTGKAVIKGQCTLTVGTNTTAVTLRIYRGTTASGTLVSGAIAQAGNFTAGSPAQFVVQATDVLSGVGVAQYCMTIQATGASANGSVTTALLETEVLSG